MPGCQHGSMHPLRLVVVEDDDAISAPLRRGLEREGYEVTVCNDGVQGLETALDPRVAVVVLDVGLPGLDGIEVCRRLRDARPRVQILLLTALAEEVHAVDGLDAGADDYIAKPFRLAEFLARVRAAARRIDPVSLVEGRLRLDRSARRAFVDGDEVELTAKEFDLLARLMADAGRVVTREQLAEDVWHTGWLGSSRTIDQHILWLRNKLGAERITTIRGHGFRFERDDR